MNAQELFTANGKPTGIYACSQCGLLNRDRHVVNQCCICRFCNEPIEDRKREYTGCHSRCWFENQAKRDRERLEKAELVDDYDGPLYSINGWGRDGFIFDDVMDVLVESVDSPDDWPEFMFCCKAHPFPKLDVSELVERCTDDLYEDAADDVTVPQSLVEALEEFNELNKDVIAWDPDYSRKVRVPPMPHSNS